MSWIRMPIIYTGFFSLIAYAVYLENSAVPLWALCLAPLFWRRVVED